MTIQPSTPLRTDLAHAAWRASRHSASNGGQCVEVADHLPRQPPGLLAVRDSRQPAGPALFLTPVAWASFTGRLRRLT